MDKHIATIPRAVRRMESINNNRNRAVDEFKLEFAAESASH
jgi:hypothetical protein